MADEKLGTVLVVDDAPEHIDVLGEILRDEFHVKAANSGRKALDIVFAAAPPDLILLDILMPDMSGYEVCRRLKADERAREIPVIFVTVLDEEQDETKGFDLGAVDYITKPFSPAIVSARVKAHLELAMARKKLKDQNKALKETARLRENVEMLTRHDLKNPLGSIMGAVDLLGMERRLTDDQVKLVTLIEDCSYRILDMINSSLDLCKIEGGTYQLRPGDVDLVKLTNRLLVENSGLARSKGIAFQVLLAGRSVSEGDTFPLRGEELLLYSMLTNLIKNALEASPPGGQVTISIDGRDAAVIKIHNLGAVPESIRESFFDKYVTAAKAGGTGLGTYSAYLIAQLHGGSISLATSEDAGTTVTVIIPN